MAISGVISDHLLEDLDRMDQRGVYYISRLKLNNRIYKKNPEPEYFQDGTIKKQTEYLPLDLEEVMHLLQPGETMEIRNAYIRMYQKLPVRVVLYQLTKIQVQKRKDEKIKPIKRRKKGLRIPKKAGDSFCDLLDLI